MENNIGIDSKTKEAICKQLCQILASNFSLYLKTQNYHWNVTGPSFKQLHDLFELQYQDLREANDDLAERVRTLGYRAPGTFREMQKLSFIPEESDTKNSTEASQMVKALSSDHQQIVRTIRDLLPAIQEVKDEATNDLLTIRLKRHEKMAWMLNSIISNGKHVVNPGVAA